MERITSLNQVQLIIAEIDSGKKDADANPAVRLQMRMFGRTIWQSTPYPTIDLLMRDLFTKGDDLPGEGAPTAVLGNDAV